MHNFQKLSPSQLSEFSRISFQMTFPGMLKRMFFEIFFHGLNLHPPNGISVIVGPDHYLKYSTSP